MDIKTQNVLFLKKYNKYFLADFGALINYIEGQTIISQFTLAFLSPEFY